MALAARAYQFEEPAQPAKRQIRKRATRRASAVRVRLAGRGVRVGALIALPIALVFTYVWLTAELTAQTYRLHDDQALQSALAQRDNELRQQVARLESLPRLEAAAAKLHMHVPTGVALVAPAQTARVPKMTALALSFADVRKWFGIR